MIFYGTSASRLKDGRLGNVTCPNCDSQTSMNYSIFGKYFYIYWIPFFPLGKSNILECNNCKRTYKLSELPNQIQQRFELEKHKGVPIKHFAGLGIIALLISWFSYSSMKDKENEAIYIESPMVGDVYSTTTQSSSYYTTAKVSKIEGDSIFVIFNNYEIDKKYSTSEIDKAVNYDEINTEGFTLDEIQQLYKDEIIYEIDRD